MCDIPVCAVDIVIYSGHIFIKKNYQKKLYKLSVYSNSSKSITIATGCDWIYKRCFIWKLDMWVSDRCLE